MWLLSLLLSVFFHHYKTVVPRGSYAVGEVIQANDFSRGDLWSTDVEDLATDPSQVVGHTVLKPLRGGSNIRLSDVSK
jgi:flagella basal body P-ring formation protein FlgA